MLNKDKPSFLQFEDIGSIFSNTFWIIAIYREETFKAKRSGEGWTEVLTWMAGKLAGEKNRQSTK